VLALAEKIGAPVVAFRTGKGVVDSRHPLSLTTVAGFKLWDNTDLLIGIGSRLEVPLARWAPAPAGVKIGRIDIDPAEHRRLAVDVPIVADAADGARALTAAVKKKDDPARRDAIAAAKAAALAQVSKAQPQYGYLEVIREALPDDGIVIDELTQVAYIGWYGYPVYKPRTFISSGFSGTLGYGFPTALGVKVGNPDRAVVSITGDGGFLFGGSDLATAMQFGINLVTVVVNNSSYGNVLRDQQRMFEGRHSGSVLTNPDFTAYARAFGVSAWRVENADELRDALREALAANAPAVIEVVSDIAKDYSPSEFHQPKRA
jgi:acetolactate synthase I/II/III large subunit